MRLSTLLSACLTASILAYVLIYPTLASDQQTASSAIQQAEAAVSSAYRAILDTESTGTNVSVLLSRLSGSAELLAKANMAYANGDFGNATVSAEQSAEIADSVKVEAYKTRDLTLAGNAQRFQLSLAESILGVGAVLVASFLSWRLFKKRYTHHILELKPELSNDES